MQVHRSLVFAESLAALEKDGQADGLLGQIENLEQQIRLRNGYFEVSQLFDGMYPYLKKRIRKFRVICRIVDDGYQQVLVFVQVFARQDPRYTEFYSRREDFNFDPIWQEIDFERLGESDEDKASKKLPLPHTLNKWIEPLSELQIGMEAVGFQIHETRSWAESIDRNYLQTSLGIQLVHQVVLGVIQELEKDRSCVIGDINIADQQSCFIVWGLRSATEVVFFSASPRRPDGELLQSALRTMESDNYHAEVRRAYWSFIVFDDVEWMNIQKEINGNLFLSQDEIDVLGGLSGIQTEGSMPAVLSGRAGSGKSTMLAYVFAALVTRKFRFGLEGKPIYLVYNERLLGSARRSVGALLRANADLRQNLGPKESQEIEDFAEELTSSNFRSDLFQSYYEFLKRYVSEDRQEFFEKRSRVDFSDFKISYLNRDGRSVLPRFPNVTLPRLISAERAWFVIRQFIKGFAPASTESTEFLDEEVFSNFDELPEKERSGVSRDELEKIYRNVYIAWYRNALKQNGLWDDQDLVLEALEGLDGISADRELIPAIICDESQDFTPREIRFIIRSCGLLRYSLPTVAQLSIPIVLAGDSLQTLSPTGFRWSAVTATLYEEVSSCTGVQKKINPLNLGVNYRSRKAIVNFCNLIQLWRRELFPAVRNEIDPQSAWDSSPSVAPRIYEVGKNIAADEVLEIAKQSFILLPCEESGEMEFIRQDPILKKLSEDPNWEIPPTIMSSSAAKGLEFGSIFLYNFGRQFATEGFTIRDLLRGDDGHSNLKYAAEYFFNKLYVAASRASQSISIIEYSQDVEALGSDSLWGCFVGDADSDELQFSLPPVVSNLCEKHLKFRGLVQTAQVGYTNGWKDVNAKLSIDDADSTFASGREGRNADQLRRASRMYKSLGEEYAPRSLEAEALALGVEKRFRESFNLFVAAKLYAEAWAVAIESCELWNEAEALLENDFEVDESSRRLVRFMCADENDVAEVLTIAGDIVNESTHRSVFESREWNFAFKKIKTMLSIFIEEVETVGSDTFGVLDNLRLLVSQIVARGLGQLRAETGDLSFLQGNWQDAVDFYRQALLTAKQEKRRDLAIASGQGFPEGLRHLCSKRLFLEVINIWEGDGRPVDHGWYSDVYQALVELGRWQDALEVALRTQETGDAVRIAVHAVGGPLVSEQNLERLIELCSRTLSTYENLPKLLERLKSHDLLKSLRLSAKIIENAVRIWDSPRDFGYLISSFQKEGIDKAGFDNDCLDGLSKVLEVYDPLKLEMVLDPRWHGLAYELVQDYRLAAEYFSKFTTKSADSEVRQFSRRAVLRNWSQHEKQQSGGARRGVQKFNASETRHAKNELRRLETAWKIPQSEWSLGNKSLLSRIEPYYERSGDGSRPNGDFGPFRWTTQGKKTVLIHFGTDVSMWTIDADGGRVERSTGDSMPKAKDGCVRFSINPWNVEIRLSTGETKVTISHQTDTDEEDVIRIIR